MDDATASDNCGEVTIEVSSETTAGVLPALRDRSLHATDDAGNSAGFANHHRSGHHSAGVHLRPCRLHRRVFDEMPMDDATASDVVRSPSKCRETTAGDAAGNYVIVRTFSHRRRWKQRSASQTITVTSAEFTFVPEGFAVSCSSNCLQNTTWPLQLTTAAK